MGARDHATGLGLALRTAAGLAALALLTGSAVVSCKGDPTGSAAAPDNRPDSASMGRWTPSTDTTRFPKECTKEVHDSYYVIGPDGRKYPTWHAATHVDATSGEVCYFGHEHGDNPAGSALWNELRRHFAWDANANGTIEDSEWNTARSGVPFGYAAEYGGTPAAILHDSYKIAFANGVTRQRLVNGNAQDFGLSCNQLLAYAHDTHTSFGFNENRHPVTYAIDCAGSGDSAGYLTRMIVSVMADFGSAGADAPRTGEVAAGRAFPATTTQVWPNAFVVAGQNADLAAALEERWDAIVTLRTSAGAELARLNPGLINRTPARHRSGTAATQSIDLCYSGLNASGTLVSDPAQAASIVRQVRGTGTACALLSPTGPATTVGQRIRFDARDGAFKGCDRRVVFRDQSIRNGTGPATWYTDANGQNGRTTAFTGALRQQLAVGLSTSTVTLTSVTDDASIDCATATGVRVRVAAQ